MSRKDSTAKTKAMLHEALPDVITTLKELLKAKDPSVRLEASRLLLDLKNKPPTSWEDPIDLTWDPDPKEPKP